MANENRMMTKREHRLHAFSVKADENGIGAAMVARHPILALRYLMGKKDSAEAKQPEWGPGQGKRDEFGEMLAGEIRKHFHKKSE